MRLGRIFYVLAILLCVLETARLWHASPDQMAAHFDVYGNPDRFVLKAAFFWFQIQTLLIVAAVSLLPQILFFFLPAKLINLPHRAYWFTPKRRSETVDRLSSFAALMFGIIFLAILSAFELSVYANFQTPIHFNAHGMLMVMVAAVVLILLALLQLRFSFRLPASSD